MLRSWLALAVLAGAGGAQSFDEALRAQGLLGAHFGRAGLSASFDYVVVGGGTGGLAIARRLASSAASVAVIEAGGFYELDNGNLSTIPADDAFFVGKDPAFNNPLIDWEQRTTPQPGLGGETALYSQGKTFGGGSARNFMFYHRGTKGAYQRWAQEVGDNSYDFDSFLPYFKKSVHFTPPNQAERAPNATVQFDAAAFSPSGGPLQVAYPNWANPVSSWIRKALQQLHLKEIPGFNSGNLLGFQYVSTTIDSVQQTRSSSETSFLREALEQTTNLVAYKSTLAKKILFDDNCKATGVAVSSGGALYTINATKEVIVSAGAFRSPQLLMVSGVGPAATLRQHGIPVIANRPGVGQNMWDHVLLGPSYKVDVTTHSELGGPAGAEADAEYIRNRTGILTNPGADLIAFEKLPNGSVTPSVRAALDNAFPADWPDLELLFLDAYSGTQRDLVFGAPRDSANYASSIAGLVAPFSRGNVTIASADTAVNPIISPNWLLDPRDQAVAVAAFKRMRAVFTQSAMQPIVLAEAYPGTDVTSDADILAIIRQSMNTVYHAAATCRMGISTDPMAVVDARARVLGVNGVRVVDASAFPFLPPGHPQATVYALAEKIAADILGSGTPS